jgi:ABC-type multidrug transport system fused ATPase/permease subunit
MEHPLLCVYTNDENQYLLYNGRVDNKYTIEIEKIIKKMLEQKIESLIIDYDNKKEFYCQIIDKYIYILICEKKSLKMFDLINKINNFIISQTTTNFNLITRVLEEIIKTHMEQENKVEKINDQLKNITTTMTDTIALTIERQNRINDLEDKSNIIANNAKLFEHDTTTLKKKIQWKNIKMSLIIFFVIVIIILFIVLIFSV